MTKERATFHKDWFLSRGALNLSCPQIQPGLASWAKFSMFSRPYGTEFRNEVLTDSERPYLRFRVDAFDEPGGVGVGPVRMLGFQLSADLFARVLDGHTLLLQRQRPRLYPGDQVSFRTPPTNHLRARYGRVICARH